MTVVANKPRSRACAACDIRIGGSFETNELYPEPFAADPANPQLVCAYCHDSLMRRRLSVSDSHQRDSKQRIRKLFPDAPAKRRGRKRKIL